VIFIWPLLRETDSIALKLSSHGRKRSKLKKQAAQRSGGVTIPGGVKKMCRRGTSGHGLVHMVVLD